MNAKKLTSKDVTLTQVKEICWETWSTSSSDKMGQELLECLGDASLTQKVDFCTRIREGQNASLIDLIGVGKRR